MDEYTVYECISDKKEFILITEELEAASREGKYITCPYCNSKRVKNVGTSNSIKECMRERSYKRIHGVIVQR
ncbi:hypothetical protein [Clostridium intestinale]|uniref:hypothetical protein n=1 Tax=Clostridium intestinale TaxID=36845 RepID=UPI002DD699D1|nr:hypothetical protein [Clostridium intestinale]WRY53941.1 hypothetical protein P8F83_12175 [Clostridium intestinale]